ncbi:11452_t:CDS:2, partial [Gigaspora rosea]
EYSVNYIVNIKTSEAWLQFAKSYPLNYKQIDNDSKYRDFKVQLALYKKKSCIINYPEDISLMEKQINSAKIIQYAVIKWLYRPSGLFMKQAKDRYYQN